MKHSDEMPGYTGGAIVHTTEYLEHRRRYGVTATALRTAEAIEDYKREAKQEQADKRLKEAQRELEKKKYEEERKKKVNNQPRENRENASAKLAEVHGRAMANKPSKVSYTSSDYAKWGNKIPSDASSSDIANFADFVLNKYADDYRAFNQFMDYMKQQIGTKYKTFVEIVNKKLNSRQARNSRSYAPSTPTMKHSALSAIHFIGE